MRGEKEAVLFTQVVRTTSRGERHGALLKGLDRILQVEKREGVAGRGQSPRREREGVLIGQGESSVSNVGGATQG